jgi:hypothetical protein
LYFVVETIEQLERLPKPEKCFIDLVTLSEDAHPKLTAPSVIYYNDFNKGYILPIKHSEAFSLNFEDVLKFLKEIPTVYLLDKKWHSYFIDLPNAVDVYFTILDTENEIQDLNCFTPVHLDFYNRFRYQENVNHIIPISKHYERCECLFERVYPYFGKERNLAWINEYISVYKWVEEQGIGIDPKLFDKYFEPNWKARSVNGGRIYTSYNLYNITSRPTNAFNGINFLAFNKENNSKSAFVPVNDRFIELDFDGYHLRLINNIFNRKFGLDESVHVSLGREYFGVEELTAEQYQESKKITFRQLYNGIEEELKKISIFQDIAEFIEMMWMNFKETGFVELPNGRRLSKGDFNPQKLFNYYIQCLETVNNTKKLSKLKKLLEGKKTKIVLVVYDSMLIDYSADDGKETLNQIKQILEEDGYGVKAKIGTNYNFSK